MRSEQFPNRIQGSLGDETVEADLRALDETIARVADDAVNDAPAGLANRVFEASVSMLPEPAPRHVAVVGTVGTVGGVGRVQWWGRLAMAASVGIAVIMASTLTTTPLDETTHTDVALSAYRDVLESAPFAGDEEDQAFAHLLRTVALSSYQEVTGELEMLISEFEM